MRFDEKSSSVINFKLTPTEKERIKAAAASKNMTISEYIRYACERIFNEQKNLGKLD